MPVQRARHSWATTSPLHSPSQQATENYPCISDPATAAPRLWAGSAFWFLSSGMEWQLYSPETSGLYSSNYTWAYIHPVPQQPKPHFWPPPPPWWPPAFSAHSIVLPSVWFPGYSCTSGPFAGISWGLTTGAPADIQPLAPRWHRASGHCGHQPTAFALPHLAPTGTVQAPLSPALIHCLTRLRQFSSQPHQNKPVPIHLSCAAVSFIPPEGYLSSANLNP